MDTSRDRLLQEAREAEQRIDQMLKLIDSWRLQFVPEKARSKRPAKRRTKKMETKRAG